MAEQPIRIPKVHMKVFGSFRAEDMARGFCRMRGYVVSCERNGINAFKAISMLIEGRTPTLISQRLPKPESTVPMRDAA
ncbi:MAG: hypothetical protein LBR80_18520 [Deltaproteobacteria bacterium]|nr:hypothetical protein [Deltaproteobacteria bacterium]